MAIAYRSHTSAQQLTDNASLTLTKPAGLATGDVLLLLVHTRERELGFNTPDGFTQVGETFGFWHWHHWHGQEDRHRWHGTWWDVHDHHRHRGHHHWHWNHEPQGETAVYYKVVADAALEPASYSLTPKQGYDDTYGIAVAYSGVSATDPIVDSDFHVTHSRHSGKATIGDVAVSKGGVVVAFATDYTMTQQWSTATGFTERADTLGMALSDRTFAKAGYAGVRTVEATPTSTRCAKWVQACAISLRAANVAPNAPALAAPLTGAVLDREQGHRFSWAFSDDEGDTQSAYDLRYKLVTGTTWTTLSAMSPSAFADVAPGTFDPGEYEWQVRTTDQGDLVGPFSASNTFTAITPPDAPVITAPTSGGTVNSNEYVVTWTATSQEAFQVRTLGDAADQTPDESVVHTDSGEVVNASLRTHTTTFAENGRVEHVQVRVRLNGLWSPWASHRATVTYTPPATPAFFISVRAEVGAIDVICQNPVPTGGQPDVAYNEVWVDDGDGLTLRATNLPPNTTWRYLTARSGVTYSPTNVRVKAIGVNGSVSWSAQV